MPDRDVYERLAKKLDKMPHGYPATDTGIELKILRKIFTPEEAEMALQIKAMPETASMAAERLNKPLEEMQAILDDMVRKGQIGTFTMSGQQVYMFFPFIIGIYEFQVHRMDKELAELIEAYVPHLLPAVGGFEPAMARVVPVRQPIQADLLVHTYEDVRDMIDQANSFQVAPCICRKEKALEGHGCTHTKHNCLSMSKEKGSFDRYKLGKQISREEALKLLDAAEEEGLVHCTYNVMDGHAFICNCCSCCCGLLRGLKEFNAPHLVAKSNFVAAIDEGTCIQCGACHDERCPMDAILEEEGTYRVDTRRCIGCGVCATTCPVDAIALVRKADEDQDAPPANLIDWSIRRARTRKEAAKEG